MGQIKEITSSQSRETSSAQEYEILGTVGETPDGKRYRYAENGGVALAPGKVNVAKADVDNHINRACDVARAVGATTISATLGATAATAEQYKDGYVVVNDAAGEGISYRIRGHAAAASSGVLTVDLYQDEPIKVALTTSSEVSFISNPWKDVIVSPSAIAHRVVGVNNVTIALDEFGWLQTRGDCAVLSDGVIAKGVEGILSDAVDGALETRVDATIVRGIGYASEATVDTEYMNIVLTIE